MIFEIVFKTKFRSPEMETEKGMKEALEHHVKTLAQFEDLRSRNFRSRGKDQESRKPKNQYRFTMKSKTDEKPKLLKNKVKTAKKMDEADKWKLE